MTSDTPLEATLVIKLHEQMTEEFDSLDTITTSGQQESQVGFDTTVSVVKPTFFQYKRPRTLASGDIKFKIDDDQRDSLDTFAQMFNKPSVFYVFPLVTGHEWLPETLSRTVFVDAEAVESDTTQIYIPRTFARNNGITNRYRGDDLDACINGQRVSENVPHDQVWAWQEFRTQLLGCSLGDPIETRPATWDHDRKVSIERSNRRRGDVEQPPVGASVAVFGSDEFQL